MSRIVVPLVFLLAAAAPPGARAETQLCTKINALPAVISTQGPYCLGKSLTTSITSGTAIEIAANNVTLDCNGYRLGGVTGGEESTAIGVFSMGRQNTVVRNCTIRGFAAGILIIPNGPNTAGHVVERNRLDGILNEAITVHGDASVVRDNQVVDTGVFNGTLALGIRVEGTVDVIDNLVEGVGVSEDEAYGIYSVTNSGATIDGNRIRGIVGGETSVGISINQLSGAMVMRGNVISNTGTTAGPAIDCNNSYHLAIDNQTTGFTTSIDACTDGGGNVSF